MYCNAKILGSMIFMAMMAMGIAMMMVAFATSHPKWDNLVWKKIRRLINVPDLKKLMCCLLFGIMLISIRYSKFEPIMSKASLITIPRCAKYSEELAESTCENTCGRSSGPSFGFSPSIHRSY